MADYLNWPDMNANLEPLNPKPKISLPESLARTLTNVEEISNTVKIHGLIAACLLGALPKKWQSISFGGMWMSTQLSMLKQTFNCRKVQQGL